MKFFFLFILLVGIPFKHLNAQLDHARKLELLKHTETVPENISKNLNELVNYLVPAAQSEEEKAYLIYAWITRNIKYDKAAITNGKSYDFAANLVLSKKKTMTLGYCMLYEAMALEAGLDARTIVGYAKNSIEEGKKLRNPNHAWNAVFFEDKWHLLDNTFGAGFLIKKDKDVKVKQVFDDFWFDTDPRIFIFSHLPDIAKWTLIDIPVDLLNFKKIPPISNEFFEVGYTLESVYPSALKAEKAHIPSIFYTKQKWFIEEGPGPDALIQNNRYSMKISSEDYKKLVIISGKRSIVFAASKGVFNCEFIAEGSKVLFVFYPKDSSKEGEVALLYKVVSVNDVK